MSFGDVDFGQVLLRYLCLLFSLSFHEAAHAVTADRCGDPTGRLMGRATLNPIPHIDPLGTLILPLAMMFTGVPILFGWAKPVPFNPRNLRNIRRDPALIGLSGPVSNLVLAITFALFLRVVVVFLNVVPAISVLHILLLIAVQMVVVNLVLMLFNLIPVPPLDGHHLLYPFLPEGGQRVMDQIGPFGLLIVILFAGQIISVPFNALMHLVEWFAFLGHG